MSWIESIPIDSIKIKVYKLRSLNNDLAAYFSKLATSPLDYCLLLGFYFLVSFLPSLVMAGLSGIFLPAKGT